MFIRQPSLDARGASLVEFAIVLPILMLILVVSTVYFLLVANLGRVSDATFEGLAYAPMTDLSDLAKSKQQIEERVRTVIDEEGGCFHCDNLVITATHNRPAQEVTVAVSFDFAYFPLQIPGAAPLPVDYLQVGFCP